MAPNVPIPNRLRTTGGRCHAQHRNDPTAVPFACSGKRDRRSLSADSAACHCRQATSCAPRRRTRTARACRASALDRGRRCRAVGVRHPTCPTHLGPITRGLWEAHVWPARCRVARHPRGSRDRRPPQPSANSKYRRPPMIALSYGGPLPMCDEARPHADPVSLRLPRRSAARVRRAGGRARARGRVRALAN